MGPCNGRNAIERLMIQKTDMPLLLYEEVIGHVP